MPRKALIVGINDYDNVPSLSGPVNDATRMHQLLARNDDHTVNFHCDFVTSNNGKTDQITILKKLERLFSGRSEATVFYFSGHGSLKAYGGFLATREASKYSLGINMAELLDLAGSALRERRHSEVIIILDCCHSGALGNGSDGAKVAALPDGLSILTASSEDELAVEESGGGRFTNFLVDGLGGAAADILGRVTVASLYNYADQLLGPFHQRPVFKSHISKMIALRTCEAKVDMGYLRKLPGIFPIKHEKRFALSPEFEAEGGHSDSELAEVYEILLRLNRLDLVQPYGVSGAHGYSIYWAAMAGDGTLEKTGCELTPLGHLYWRMAYTGKI